jgi:hypothetical protein
MRLLLLGCSGFVGRELVPFLLELGHEVTLVSRQAQPFAGLVGKRLACLQLDPADPASWAHNGLDVAVSQAAGVVNLAGEPIADRRWTPAHRALLLQSRVRTTEQLVAAMGRLETPPAVLVNGSAVGYYGSSLESRFQETSPAGNDFLAEICQRWEAAADQDAVEVTGRPAALASGLLQVVELAGAARRVPHGCAALVPSSSVVDRVQLLHTLATLPQHPESVPINQLVQVEGTPLHGLPALDPLELVRTIATARLLMPKSYLRLSAGRTDMSDAVQALCFLAGANSIFYGERLLTTPNPGRSRDEELFTRLGLAAEASPAGPAA